jgi:hypothetical protein
MLIYDVQYRICNYAAKVQKNCYICKFFIYSLEICNPKNSPKGIVLQSEPIYKTINLSPKYVIRNYPL